MPNTLYYLNALFDLQIGNFQYDNVLKGAAEMEILFGFSGTEKDRLLTTALIHPGHIPYLSEAGLSFPRLCTSENDCKEYKAEVWGWNSQSLDAVRRVHAECFHPDLDSVRNVNGREFCMNLWKIRQNMGIPESRLCPTLESVLTQIESMNVEHAVIKPLFGNSGYGFIHIKNRDVNSIHKKQIQNLIACQNAVVVEPWLNRVYDLSTRFYVKPDGAITSVTHHQMHTQQYGGFFAILLENENPVISPWKNELAECAAVAGEALSQAGYFGPAGFDSFVWLDDCSRHRLAPIIEINARHAMSTIAYALKRRLAPNHICYFRFISRKKHLLPDSYDRFKEILGDMCWNSGLEKGILLASPIRVNHGNGWIQPERSAFFIAAHSRKEMLEMDGLLRNILAK
jgi:hypothetical protein